MTIKRKPKTKIKNSRKSRSQNIFFSFFLLIVISLTSLFVWQKLFAFHFWSKVLGTESTTPIQTTSPTSYRGFFTQLRITDVSNSGLNQAAFQNLVNYMVSQNIPHPSIRVALPIDEIFPHLTSGSSISCESTIVNCNPTILNNVKTALASAKSKNIQIIAVTSNPCWAWYLDNPPANNPCAAVRFPDINEYKSITRSVHAALAKSLADQVDVWDLFNEANANTFDSHRPINNSEYANVATTFATLFNEARIAVKTNDPTSLVTHDMAGFPEVGDSDRSRWYQFLHILTTNTQLDLLSLNVYPGNSNSGMNENFVSNMKPRLATLSQQYGKPIAITETGLCTGDNSDQDQQKLVPFFAQEFLKDSLYNVTVYQYQDDNLTWKSTCEKNFGLINENNLPKLALRNVISAFQGQTVTPIPTLPTNCTQTFTDSFDGPNGSSIDWNKWVNAGGPYTINNGSLQQHRGDWIQAKLPPPGVLATNFLLSLNFEQMAISGSWGSININIVDPTTLQTRYDFVLVKDQYGYTLKFDMGNSVKRFYLGSSISSPANLTLWKTGQTIKAAYNNRILGIVNDFSLTGLPTNPVTFIVGTNGELNTTPSVLYDDVTVRSCQ